jgi:hypothetical protein
MAADLPPAPARVNIGVFHAMLDRFGGALLSLLFVTAALGVAAMASTSLFTSGVRDAQALSLPVTAESFVGELAAQNGGRWPSPASAPAPGRAGRVPSPHAADVDLRPLRTSLFIDSFVVIPSYLGVLLLEIVLLSLAASGGRDLVSMPGHMRWPELRLHLLCMVPVAVASFDIAENGILIRACEDAVSLVLADDTVRDKALASTLKWAFLGAASAILTGVAARAHRAAGDRADVRRRLRAAMFAGAISVAASVVTTSVFARALANGIDPTGSVTDSEALQLVALVLQWLAVRSVLARWHPQAPWRASKRRPKREGT